MPKKRMLTLCHICFRNFFFFKEKQSISDTCVFPLLSFHPLLSQGQDSDEDNGESFQYVCCKQIHIDRHGAICILQYTLF